MQITKLTKVQEKARKERSYCSVENGGANLVKARIHFLLSLFEYAFHVLMAHVDYVID